ncbi:MAG: hypothetical protein FGM54_04685 [Chitinophagaceae bacterium]|nr:hypothetical protein [Chitinophagaceae bacterium]
MKKTSGIYLLILLIFFVSGFYAFGTYLIFTDTSGNEAGLETGRLFQLTSLRSYSIIGALLAVLGVIFPLFTAMCLISRPTSLKWPKSMNIYENYQWTYAFSMYTTYFYLFISAINILLREGNSMFPTIVILACLIMMIILNSPENQKFFIKKVKKSKSSSFE